MDECLGTPHLNLAVIYHLEQRYVEAMIHYTSAKQLDSGMYSSLINENMSKLRRKQIMLYNQQQQQQHQQHKHKDNQQLLYSTSTFQTEPNYSYNNKIENHHFSLFSSTSFQTLTTTIANTQSVQQKQQRTCQSRVPQSTSSTNPPPNTTFDQVKRSLVTFISDMDTATETTMFRLLRLHTPSHILSSL